MDLRGKRALVMGLGVHGGGLGVARFLAAQGALVTVTDLRDAEALKPSLDHLAGLPIRYVLGEHREDDFRAADLVVRNPGVPRESRFLQVARAAGAAIEMEMSLFFRLCRGPILGITGTKGKTTTTLLAGAMLREQHPDTVVAGNLRISALEQLPRITPTTPVVLELSSWQLEGLGEAQLSPTYACVTNLSPDHLDRYGSLEAYAEAKQQIFVWQPPTGVVVLNHDDPEVSRWAARAPGRVAWFGRTAAHGALFNDSGVCWQGAHICGADEVALPGQHNLANVAAAAALALSFGVPIEAVRRAVRAFRGVEHRLELVRTLDGVRYINDTAATSPAAALAALESFTQPIVLIAGGADKNLTFEHLAEAAVGRTRAVVLLQGSATEKLMRSLYAALQVRRSTPGAPLPQIYGPYDDLARAVDLARELAAPGDVVLLSPGCASFGMFRNEFHRGEEFRRIVAEL